MGFLAGLAEGFGNTFNAMENRRQARESDVMRMAYDQYVAKQSQWLKDSKEDQQNIDLAKSITNGLASNGVPAEAWDQAYQYLKGGATPEQTEKYMQSRSFSIAASAPMAETPKLAMNQENAMFGQNPTQQADLTPGKTGPAMAAQDISTAPSVGQDPNVMGSQASPSGNIFDDIKKNGTQARIAHAQQKLISELGITQEEFDKYNAGYKSPVQGDSKVQVTDVRAASGPDGDPNKALVAITKNGGVVWGNRQADGSFQTYDHQIIPPDQISKITTQDGWTATNKAAQDVYPVTKDYAANKASAISMVSDFKSMADLAKKNPIVLQRVGLIPNVLNEVKNEISGLSSLFANGSEQEIAQKEKEVEQKVLSGLDLSKVGQDASDIQAFASMAVQVKFKVARLLNGSGTLANADVKAAGEEILSNNDPKIFLRNAQKITQSLSKSVDITGQELAKQPLVLNAKSLGVQGIDDLFTPIGDVMGGENSDWMNAPDDSSSALGDEANQGNVPAQPEDTKAVVFQNKVYGAQAKTLGVPEGTMVTVYSDGSHNP